MFNLQGGLCYYCNQPMDLIEGHTKTPPPHMATFEHLDDRWSPERGKHPGEFRVVLACLRCNNARNRQREAEVGIEILRERARHGREEDSQAS